MGERYKLPVGSGADIQLFTDACIFTVYRHRLWTQKSYSCL